MLSLGMVMSKVATADPTLPYTPSWVARHQLARLADEAGLRITLTQWPVPSAALREALQALPSDLPESLAQARDDVLFDMRRADRPAITLRARSRAEALVGFDDDYVPGSAVALRSGALGNADARHIAFSLGGRLEQQAGSLLIGSATTFGTPRAVSARLDDSVIAVEWSGVQLQAFAHRDWWGPSWQNSLILGNNAPPWLGVGLQRAQMVPSESHWLAWLGAWNGEFFVAKAQDPQVALDQPQGYLFAGTRLTLKPHPQIELGITRTWQTGGRGRPDGPRAFLRAMLGRGTNAPGEAEQAIDPGNQMAGFDLRIGCGRIARCALYTQAIGEDSADGVPTKYLALFGAEAWSADGRHRWFAEYANTSCRGLPWEQEQPVCAYRNYAYPQGYTNASRWAGASIGPDSRVVTLGWYAVADERRVRMHVGRVGVSLGAFAPGVDAPRGLLRAISIEQGWHVGRVALAGRFDWTHLRDGADIGANRRTDVQLGITATWAPD